MILPEVPVGCRSVAPTRRSRRAPARTARDSSCGTSTRRLNSATSVPSCLYTRVWTFTVPRSGFERDSFFSSTSDSTNSVSPWKTGAGWLSSSVARLAIALPLTSETAHAQRQRVDERPDDDVLALLALARVDVVEVQRVVVHRDQAEEVVVGLGHGLRRPVLVDVADLELLEVAAIWMSPGRLAGGLVGFKLMGVGAHKGLDSP